MSGIPSDVRDKLTPEQYHICIEKGTEPPFTGKLLHCTDTGKYCCTCCGAELFDSATKFDSGTGWPSFSGAISDAIEYVEDHTMGMVRTEVNCKKCGSHLGHIFDDGPAPSGRRYCINSLSLYIKRD